MENVKTSLNGYQLTGELKGVPVAFVNAIRRIAMSELPLVVPTNVEILENTSGLTHEMLRHRIEQMPVNVKPTEVDVIRDTRLELKTGATDAVVEVDTDAITIFGTARKDILLKDRDLGTPGYLIRLTPGQTLHLKATLGLTTGSHVCVSTFRNHCDPEKLKNVRRDWELAGKDVREFDNFGFQRYYERDEDDRPYWFDLTIESIGVIPAKDLLKMSLEVLKTKLTEFFKSPVERVGTGEFQMKGPGETHTVGALVQALLYLDKNVEYASYHTGHPLTPELKVTFTTKQAPDSILETLKRRALDLCENVLRSV